MGCLRLRREALRSEQAGDGQLGQIELAARALGTLWLTTLLEQYERLPWQMALYRYVALREGRKLIGTVGAFAHPGLLEEREIGYSILPPHKGRGPATQAVRALIEAIRVEGVVGTVIARTFPHLLVSIRVMKKCGMRFDGEGRRYVTGWVCDGSLSLARNGRRGLHAADGSGFHEGLQ